MQAEQIIKQIKSVCGLEVSAVPTPKDMPSGGVLRDEKNGRIVFSVAKDGRAYTFGMRCNGDGDMVTAALAREYVIGLLAKAPSDPLAEFLRGASAVPQGVHVGKSDYFVFAVYGEAGNHNVTEYLATMADECDFVVDMSEGITAFCKVSDNDTDYCSAGEFAAVLKENLSEELKERLKIGVGGVAHGVSELPKYYAYAKAALIGGAEFDPLSDVYSYKEYALIKSLSTLTAADKERYVKTVLDRSYREVLSDPELMTAADAFIKHSLNISEASRSMYVHRNTLIYRLDKIERLTGLNIRNFNDAMTFRIACLVYKML
ncbi:MAG: helix-turn-helix domain-containing protein [Clostridiales bacterium]|nr:helix-turn-helix domain-containing protein [Clostridiales bacterium]